jgi:serine/threonine-protein phosphatase 2A regulatory subunit A
VEDEILCIIAEELGGIIPFVGGKEYYECVLAPLEQLCSVEEVLVAEKVCAFNAL